MLSRSAAQRVLVVDDQKPCSDLLVQLLAPEGFAVEVAEDGEQALSVMKDWPPDAVLLDIGLPGLNGIDVCRRIKQTHATRLTPVVLLTGSGDRQHRLAGIDAGADDFVAKPFDCEHLKARVRSLTRLKRYTDELDSAESVIVSLALTIEARDPYTEGHCDRLAKYAVSLGAALGLGSDDLAALKRGAFLHDVGKIGIPDSLLLKAQPLTPDEYAAIKQHPEIGERLLGDLRSLAPVRPIVRHHHERLDGSGYPDGLRGADVPLLAHIVSIVDAYDAMTTMRPYRPAMSRVAAIAELRRDVARGRMSRDLVEMFVAVLDGRQFPAQGKMPSSV